MAKRRRRSVMKQRVQVYLAEHGSSQRHLAAQVGISAGHLSCILSRKERPSLRVAVALETITGIPVREFAGPR